tara:strand:- start:749 stop:973 length:225 start_codon:yes stop_codon:yes gene_type:complete
MEYIGFGDIEINKLGECGGVGCSSCSCDVEVYNDHKLYVTGSMIVLQPEASSDIVILPMSTNNIKNIILKRTVL